MARIVMVRHGEAAAGWGDDPDPGLSDLGRTQAQRVATRLAQLPAATIQSSPLRRALETAVPLSEIWAAPIETVPAVGEIPSVGIALADRQRWLSATLASRWSEVESPVQAWADRLVAHLIGLGDDTIIFSHFVAINAAMARALGDDRLTVARVANTALATFDNGGGRLELVEPPSEAAETYVN